MNATVTWLAGLTCVAPFTVDDTRELYNTIKSSVPMATVDVHITPNPDTVHVTVYSPTVKGEWTYVVQKA